jgi:8-amino-3,8-dideoxy-alpha-D-manno-octulosonate transaminase
MDRRTFVAATAAAATSTTDLAAQGGRPVRATPLQARYFGPLYYGAEERAELTEVLETGRPFRWYGPGNQPPMKVATFETEFAAHMQTKYALAVTSGTGALQTAVAALGIGPGDEVIMPAWTWHSCFNAVVLAGALPIFAEIDESFNIDPNDIESKITPRTKLIMAVHLQGNPADLEKVLAIARKRNVKVLEDCAQSVGASYKGKPVGSYGDISIYSLQLNKTITAGEGGAVATSDPLLFERAVRFHDLGGLRPHHEKMIGQQRAGWYIGTNFRMNEFSGGVLLAQLRKLDTIVNSCRANAKRVYEGVRDLPGITFRRLPDPAGEIGVQVFMDFRTKERCDQFKKLMRAENVPAGNPGGSIILPTQPHIMNKVTASPNWPSFTMGRGKSIQYGPATCPRTIDILARFAGPALDPKYTKQDTDDIIAAVRKVWPAVWRS